VTVLTTHQLKRIVRPFVGKRLRGDLSEAIDILHACANRLRADVRAVTDQGVVDHFYGREELIPWGDIMEITVSALDERGNRINRIVYEHVAERCVMGRAA